jgi:Fe-S cluster assembly ATP-binding protein
VSATELAIKGLRVEVAGSEILRGVDLVVRSGEVHAVMGPNGSGKSTLSHVLAGRPGYTVTGGSVTLDGADLLAMEPWERAQAGLFLALQYPIEVPGVSLVDVLEASFAASGRDPSVVPAEMRAEADAIGLDPRLFERSLNVDLSGGEKKRSETVQLGLLRPGIAVLDELDSGLDIDALRDCSRRVEAATKEGLGVLAITHYSRLLTELHPDVIHIMVRGEIRDSGGPDLAGRLERDGYAAWFTDADRVSPATSDGPPAADPLADPFADPLA